MVGGRGGRLIKSARGEDRSDLNGTKESSVVFLKWLFWRDGEGRKGCFEREKQVPRVSRQGNWKAVSSLSRGAVCLQGWGSLWALLTRRCQADRKWVKDVGECSKVTRAWPLRLIEPPKALTCSGEWSSELELVVTQSHPKRTLMPCLVAGPGLWGISSFAIKMASALARRRGRFLKQGWTR